ncbi:hypothetical protein [Bacillus cereus]|uniref:hypothetical protein n=1 Tax=Bacillus cereus TaxID=1396 RepID=UPI000BEDC624|nr:hypothetical protein [Bacillus cereus]PDY82761.1 hypothetical protein CON06_10175 [Bacillus cereus]
MDNTCIVCESHRVSKEINGMTFCFLCHESYKDQLDTFSFIDELIQKKEGQVQKLQILYHFKRSNYQNDVIERFEQVNKINKDDLYKMKKIQKKIQQKKDIDRLLEKIKMLKKHPSVRLKYVFKKKKNE